MRLSCCVFAFGCVHASARRARQAIADSMHDKDKLLREMQSWMSSEYANAVAKYRHDGILSDTAAEELLQRSSDVQTKCQGYLNNETQLMEDGESGSERMLKQYTASTKNDLRRTGKKKHAFSIGHRMFGGRVMSANEYVEKKLKKIPLKLLTLLEALASYPEETLSKGASYGGEGWKEGHAPISIVSPLQYPFTQGPVAYVHGAYKRVSVLKLVERWPGIPKNGVHLVYHGSGMMPILTGGQYISCGAWDFTANQGHGIFTDFDPLHAPIDYLVGSQAGVSSQFKTEEVGFIWEIEAVDYRGRKAGGGFVPECHASALGDGGLGSSVNANGWLRFTMAMKENMKPTNYFNANGICKCKLRINNVFAVNRWMRNILIDYHAGTKACKEQYRCPGSKVGTWD